jgi:hypothetical protein
MFIIKKMYQTYMMTPLDIFRIHLVEHHPILSYVYATLNVPVEPVLRVWYMYEQKKPQCRNIGEIKSQ